MKHKWVKVNLKVGFKMMVNSLCFQDNVPQKTWEAKQTHSRMHIPDRNV